MKDYECDKCGHGKYLVLVMSVGDVVCEDCGEWQCAQLNSAWERVG
jgi:transcription elongation factor Elf1